MKVLFLTRVLSTRGGQFVVANLVRGLKAQGISLDFVAFKPVGTEDFPGCEQLFEGLDVRIIEVVGFDPAAVQEQDYVDAAKVFLREYQHEYDKIILDSWYNAIAGVLAQTDYEKTYHLAQSDPVFEPQASAELANAHLFELIPYFPVKRIVVSKSVQTLFEQRYGMKYPRINLYVDQLYHKTQFAVVDRPRLRFVSSASDFNIPAKGLQFLLDSFSKLTDRSFELTLLSGKPIKQDLNSFDFPITVTSAETSARMIDVLKDQDVYVNTSSKETFCLALAEAITLGMPAIALDSIGNRDYKRGDNFIFVDDQNDFVAQLERIYDLALRNQLHEAAKPSMSEYNLEAMVNQFRRLIDV